jgi:hypothetical protein
MATKVIREIATGMFLSSNLSKTAFVDSGRVVDVNDGTWLDASDDADSSVLASVSLVSDEYEAVDLSECE